MPLAKPSAIQPCDNSDFEGSLAGPITSSNQIVGWTIQEGYTGYVDASSASSLVAAFPNGLSSANSCNLDGCCPLPIVSPELIDCSAPGGYIDNTIGIQYPIFSVFGTGTVSGSTASNTHIPQGLYGSKVIRINNSITGDYSNNKLLKTFLVNDSNNLLRFAFISVLSPGHGMCDAAAVKVNLYDHGTNAGGTPTTVTYPTFFYK